MANNNSLNMSVTLAKSRTNQRPLGMVRRPGSLDTVPTFPPLKPNLDRNYRGIMGNAMAVPPAKDNIPQEKAEKEVAKASTMKRNLTSSKSVDSGNAQSSDPVADKSKDLRESIAREKSLKQQMVQQQRQMDDFKTQIKDKDDLVEQLQQQYQIQESHYKKLYDKEKIEHKSTRDILDDTKAEVKAKEQLIEVLAIKHKEEIGLVKTEMDAKLHKLATEKDREIITYKEKLDKLKKQMAEALKGNSWERQQQLDELTKELNRVQEEAENLRFKLKSLQRSKAKPSADLACLNCDGFQEQLTKTNAVLKEKDQSIKDLTRLCAKFEKQLEQQDDLLRMLGEQNGLKKKDSIK